jgi:hypothetical protein
MLWLHLDIGKLLLEEDRINKLWLFLDTKGFLSSLNGGRRQASEKIDIFNIEVENNSSSNSGFIYN